MSCDRCGSHNVLHRDRLGYDQLCHECLVDLLAVEPVSVSIMRRFDWRVALLATAFVSLFVVAFWYL